MGLLNWLATRVSWDLDEQVHGSAAVAQARFHIVSIEAPLLIQAHTSGPHEAEISFTAVTDAQPPSGGSEPLTKEAHSVVGTLSVDLGKAESWRGGTLTIGARVSRKDAHKDIAVLVVEIKQPAQPGAATAPLAFQTYSVEARFNAAGKAQLELAVSV